LQPRSPLGRCRIAVGISRSRLRRTARLAADRAPRRYRSTMSRADWCVRSREGSTPRVINPRFGMAATYRGGGRPQAFTSCALRQRVRIGRSSLSLFVEVAPPMLRLTRFITALVLSGGFLVTIAAPLGATNLFGLIDTGELYKSTNNGATWSAVAAIPVRDAVGFAAGSSSSELYLASRSGTVYRSSDGGSNWTAVGAVVASGVVGFTLSPFGNVLVLTRTGTRYSSSNQGTTFTAIAALVGSDWVGLARGPLGRLYAVTKTGQVAESQNQGSTWTTVGVIRTSDAVSIRRLGAQLFVLASTGEIYRS